MLGVFTVMVSVLWACGSPSTEDSAAPRIPRGYLKALEFVHNERLLRFGPFVGYYFRPEIPGDFRRLHLLCYNEGRFYASDAPDGALLFEGTAVLTDLPPLPVSLPQSEERIQPVFFQDAPPPWIASRPEPQDVYRHFHSCSDATGAVLTGYWLRHTPVRDFTYDMGGRVGPASPLYHQVRMGDETGFPQIMEFDRGLR